MSDTRYILFTGSMQPKNPMLATEDKIKEIVGAGFRQGKDFDNVSEKVLKDKLGKRGGGMMNIDEMTRPLGYKEGKEVGVRERIYNWLAPNEIMSDEELRLQNINPDSVLPEERPQAEGRPEGVLQGIFGELFGGRGAEGSTLVDFLKSKRARLMSDIQGEMQGNIFGTGVDEGKIKILQIEIDKLTEQLNDLGEK